ncbi:DNA-directed RNA polymerase sigma-70 factor [Bacteroidia bacterium]|nr:DNA-directed RNA polymerase sigma-70 factor [Bacteroidia bacterium]GHU08862.1 DNA-directed RNA polymerase sigma-70 factor [Alphaproteobacteria bacterium]
MAFISSGKSNKEDFSEIYAVYFPKLVRFSQTYVTSEQDAENIVQDVFLHLWEQWDTYESFENRNAFLFMSVKNRCIDYLRKQTLQKEQPITDLQEQEMQLRLYSLQSLDDNQLSRIELNTIIAEAIDSLPTRCREIFLLSRIEGLHHKEIAARLNISTNTIEGQITIALRKLKLRLKNIL